jgi:hypothetical protein
MWSRQRFEPQAWIAAGDTQVLVTVRIVNVGREEIETVAGATLLFTLRDGKITHIKTFQTKSEALKAVGLTE